MDSNNYRPKRYSICRRYELKIEFTPEYPFKPPKIYFVTPIYHCNINRRGEFVLIFKDGGAGNWSPL